MLASILLLSGGQAAPAPVGDYVAEGIMMQREASSNATDGTTGFPPCDALIAANLNVSMPSSDAFPHLVNGSWALATRRAPWCYVSPR